MAAAALHNLVHLLGTDLRFAVRLFDEEVAVDLTGQTIAAHIAYSADKDAAAAPTQFAVDMAMAADGVATLTLPSESTNTPGEYAYIVDFVDGADREPLLVGTLTVAESFSG